jgi:hypothetical protein
MKTKFNENHIAESLVGTSKHFNPNTAFKNQLYKELHHKSRLKNNIFNRIKSFMTRRKKVLIGVSTAIMPIFLFSLVRPAQAKEFVAAVTRCGISIECYEKKYYLENNYGDKIEVIEGQNEQGVYKGTSVSVSIDTTKKIMEKMGGVILKEDNKKISYRLSSGTLVDAIKGTKGNGTYLEWEDFYEFERQFYAEEVNGRNPLNDPGYQNDLNAYKAIEGKDPNKLIGSDRESFFRNLYEAKKPDSYDLESRTTKYTYNGEQFRFVATSNDECIIYFNILKGDIEMVRDLKINLGCPGR